MTVWPNLCCPPGPQHLGHGSRKMFGEGLNEGPARNTSKGVHPNVPVSVATTTAVVTFPPHFPMRIAAGEFTSQPDVTQEPKTHLVASALADQALTPPCEALPSNPAPDARSALPSPLLLTHLQASGKQKIALAHHNLRHLVPGGQTLTRRQKECGAQHGSHLEA